MGWMGEVGKPLWPPGCEMAHPTAQHGGLAPRRGGVPHRRVERVGLKVDELREVQVPA